MPIVEAVVDVVHKGRPTQEVLKGLMARSAKPERR
jgi:glycerol-3-phosphate dehydrogenase (NAD(P)+)